MAKEREEELKRLAEEEQLKKQKLEAQKSLKVFRSGVGKYINPEVTKRFLYIILVNNVGCCIFFLVSVVNLQMVMKQSHQRRLRKETTILILTIGSLNFCNYFYITLCKILIL